MANKDQTEVRRASFRIERKSLAQQVFLVQFTPNVRGRLHHALGGVMRGLSIRPSEHHVRVTSNERAYLMSKPVVTWQLQGDGLCFGMKICDDVLLPRKDPALSDNWISFHDKDGLEVPSC